MRSRVSGIGATLMRLEEATTENVRLVRADVFDLLRSHLETISGCYVGFPNPWPGICQSSVARRLIRPEFVNLVAKRFNPSDANLSLPPLCLATDDGAYATHSRLVLARAGWTELYVTNRRAMQPRWRTVSAYERRAVNARRVVWDLGFAPPPNLQSVSEMNGVRETSFLWRS